MRFWHLVLKFFRGRISHTVGRFHFQHWSKPHTSGYESINPDGRLACPRGLRQAEGMMEPIEVLLQKAEIAHGHMCAGQILGVRMALVGLRGVRIEDPLGTDRKRLIVYAEIDRCATDAIGMVTGCRL